MVSSAEQIGAKKKPAQGGLGGFVEGVTMLERDFDVAWGSSRLPRPLLVLPKDWPRTGRYLIARYVPGKRILREHAYYWLMTTNTAWGVLLIIGAVPKLAGLPGWWGLVLCFSGVLGMFCGRELYPVRTLDDAVVDQRWLEEGAEDGSDGGGDGKKRF